MFKGFLNGHIVAIKAYDSGHSADESVKSFKQEVDTLCKVNHPNIINCYAYSLKSKLLVVEYADCGSLHELLHPLQSDCQIEYNLAHALNWALQCAKAIQYLHSIKPKPIVHRDLKPLK